MRYQEFAKNPPVDEVLAYHGTDATITQFRPLTHFGTEKAARDRMAYKKIQGKIYRVEVDVKNPAVIKDFPGIHAPTPFAHALFDAKIFSREEMLEVTSIDANLKYSPETYQRMQNKQTSKLIQLLQSKGYDGLAYKNRYEDRGHTSLVILRPEQAHIVDEISETY